MLTSFSVSFVATLRTLFYLGVKDGQAVMSYDWKSAGHQKIHFE